MKKSKASEAMKRQWQQSIQLKENKQKIERIFT
jgi:hypothetical protein